MAGRTFSRNAILKASVEATHVATAANSSNVWTGLDFSTT
jgi:hypothetical protein